MLRFLGNPARGCWTSGSARRLGNVALLSVDDVHRLLRNIGIREQGCSQFRRQSRAEARHQVVLLKCRIGFEQVLVRSPVLHFLSIHRFDNGHIFGESESKGMSGGFVNPHIGSASPPKPPYYAQLQLARYISPDEFGNIHKSLEVYYNFRQTPNVGLVTMDPLPVVFVSVFGIDDIGGIDAICLFLVGRVILPFFPSLQVGDRSIYPFGQEIQLTRASVQEPSLV
ncbi:hypothetical protein BC938DRAFT_478947 [Jimgerdemannia flammicorona]|uniref:Uncharacterized protein n=1 Tax=Jimgerdemannia flammicorona TaxID=994334 RepID=A0A433QM04_9FUNG|nr:hypothetical protein BC938DRAFT_478947 [Jimgerdemannia flammicorona]